MKSLKKQLVSAAIAVSFGMATVPAWADDIPANIAGAVANEMRSPDNVARDAERKPAEVLAFFDVKPGQTALDLFASGGYFTEVLSGAVGPKGKVYAYYRPGQRYDDSKDKLAAQYAGFGNIAMISGTQDLLDVADNSVDVVMLSLILHHLHYDAATPDVLPEASKKLFAEIRRVLKASRKQSADWHRIDPAMAIADLTSVGFEYIGSSDVHTHPEDDEQNTWFDVGLKGKTTRLVQAYRSPD